MAFMEIKKVFLNVSSMKGVIRFGRNGKLRPMFIGPFKVLERVGKVSYRRLLPPVLVGVHSVFYISMLQKYHKDKSQYQNSSA